ncbi:MAG: LacI family DNA-binding transcriptional regulator [Egibacteraceae bacterium]
MSTSRAEVAAPTVHDVAGRAGVSHQTVSNVLNAPERVRPATRERVQRAIDELGYRPHRSARNLKARSTRTLGYLVQPIAAGAINAVLDRFLHALSDAARIQGYHILLFTRAEGQDDVAAYRELIASSAVDGFIVSETNYQDERVRFLLRREVPFAVFGRTELDEPHPWVDVDNAAGTRQAVAHLSSNGHKRIAFLGWPEGSITGDERHRGYREGLLAAGLTPHPEYEVRRPDGESEGWAACETLQALTEPPTAVVCCSDLLAAGVLRNAAARGLRVGEQCAVIGFDDTPVAAYMTPTLTSVRQPLEAVAETVIAQLIARIENPLQASGQRLLTPDLVLRTSA